MRDEIVTMLELTSPELLVPARAAPAPLELEEVDGTAAPLLRDTYVRIGAPHGWTGRTAWSDERWEDELSRPGVRAWVARVDGEVAGFFELEAGPGDDAGIVVFGLVPEFVGRGFGGELLTRAVRLAWEAAPGARRILVQTSSGDHPHARRNYERRGFRPVADAT